MLSATVKALKHLKKELPDPRQVLGGLAKPKELWPKHNDINRAAYLRETDAHKTILVLFTRLLVTSAVFKAKATRVLLRDFMKPTLEAFMIVLYVNSYGYWMKIWEAERDKIRGASGVATSGVSEDDSISDYSANRLFTSAPRGAGKYCGWTKEGVELHLHLAAVLREQRADKKYGETFEADLKVKFGNGNGRLEEVTEEGIVGAEDTASFFTDFGHEGYLADEQMNPTGYEIYEV